MAFSEYVRQRILALSWEGLKPPTILSILEEEGFKASRQGIGKFLRRLEEDGSTNRRKGSGRRPVVSTAVRNIVEEAMQADDETTVRQLHSSLTNDHGYTLSERTVLR